jgi:uncharacterized membrane protein YqgA involved in biofilm formation
MADVPHKRFTYTKANRDILHDSFGHFQQLTFGFTARGLLRPCFPAFGISEPLFYSSPEHATLRRLLTHTPEHPIMRGTILNAITVLIGSALGMLIGYRLSKKVQESVVTGLGLVTLFVGMDNAAQTGNIIIPLLSLVTGVIIGEMLDLDSKLEQFAGWLQTRLGTRLSGGNSEDKRARFIEGFVTASLVFCVGPLTILGSMQDGMGLDSGFQQLAIKSVLDGFAAMAFASSLGIGVMFSVITVLGIQGGFALTGYFAGKFMTTPMINEMTAVGGLILVGLSLVLLDLKKPRIANFLPALLLAPLIVAVARAVGIDIYPNF